MKYLPPVPPIGNVTRVPIKHTIKTILLRIGVIERVIVREGGKIYVVPGPGPEAGGQ